MGRSVVRRCRSGAGAGLRRLVEEDRSEGDGYASPPEAPAAPDIALAMAGRDAGVPAVPCVVRERQDGAGAQQELFRRRLGLVHRRSSCAGVPAREMVATTGRSTGGPWMGYAMTRVPVARRARLS